MRLDPWSWMTAIMSSLSRNPEEVLPPIPPGVSISEHGLRGTLWPDAPDPIPASVTQGADEIRICFRNRTDETVLLCWVGDNGSLHHFYALDPWHPKRRNGDTITTRDHVETSQEGHVFLIVAATDVESVQKQKSLEGNARGVRRIGAFRIDPCAASAEPGKMHLVEVMDPEAPPRWGLWRNWKVCCRPKRKWKDDDEDTDSAMEAYHRYVLTARVMSIADEEVVDTTQKYYESKFFGESKWPVMMEPKWYGRDRALEQILQQDVDHMARCLPPHALTLLRDTQPTLIWVNRTLKYGPKRCPIQGRAMCYHPGADWLREQGMHPAKAECVEMYETSEYREMRSYWGCGGIWLHEFSHAYHHKGCPDGYDNRDIQRCFEAAMKEGLYDSVRVHGPQGPTAKAYACTNAMEYFAELSTAFLGGVSRTPPADGTSKETSEEEFNKWYPFNRQQIREHDPRAYKLLKKMWKVDDA